ncbi:MAG: hydrolase [Marivirga sp.]|nr:hydrolase [Marivirga sp.]
MSEILKLKIDDVSLEGELAIPDDASGLIIFSHGSGSSRFSPRNNFVAQYLQRNQFATLLFDLLTKEEDETYSNRFNIELLSKRLVQVTRQLAKEHKVKHLPIGYFGASTGAASAMVAAAVLQDQISAVVSRGGRPDLAENNLYLVKAATLLIVGELDREVIDLNRESLDKLDGDTSLKVIRGATHLFEEPGTLEQVAQLSGDWFSKYLAHNTTSKSIMR